VPDAPVIYVADNAGLPYGTKTEAQIAARVSGLLGRMTERLRPRLVCIACNTASTIALASVREVLEVPIVGTVPAIKPAAAMTQTGVIGLLGTQATIRQAYVDRLEQNLPPTNCCCATARPNWSKPPRRNCAGARRSGGDCTRRRWIARSTGRRRIDTVLACTHFPLLTQELGAFFGPDVRYIDGADGIARRIRFLTQGQEFRRNSPDLALFTTGDGIEGLEPALTQRGLMRVDLF
jgi:glutamate racemase